MTANTIKKDPTYYGIAMHYSSILENLEIVSHNEHFQNIKPHSNGISCNIGSYSKQ